MRLAEGSIPGADRNAEAYSIHARSRVGRRRVVWTASALAGALALCAPATAQERTSGISERIESTFDLVLGNPADLAIPLTRRALARRFSEKEQESRVRPLAYGEMEDPGSTASIGASAVGETTMEQGSAEDPEGIEVARLPRPRPDSLTETASAADEDAMGGPFDLVAGAADPTVVLEATASASEVASLASDERVAGADPQPLAAPDDTQMVAASPSLPARASAGTASAEPMAELIASGACLALADVTDKDGDFKRNTDVLSEHGFCIAEETFKERRRPWRIHTVKTGRPGPLFAIMHDDEDMSFDNAVAALKAYGGTLVAVDTGGKRNQDGIDPNRNFSADGVGCRKLGDDATPKFTGLFRALFDASQPIIALHNNTGKRIPTGGLGHVSMADVPKDMEEFPSSDKDGPLAGGRALVLLTSPVPVSTTSKAEAAALSARGVNAVIEIVRKGKGDCSLSNYALLTGHSDYLNVTVDADEREKQRKIVDVIMAGRSETVATQ